SVMPALVVTIDCEEEGRWSAEYPRSGNTCRNVARMTRIHEIFLRHGVVPCYLVDYPVAVDPKSIETLRRFAEGGRAEIGAHLHPWCTPPFEQGSASGRSPTYPHNLPPEVQQAKLEALCRTIEESLGVRPSSYRAGRWGFDHRSITALERCGIRV